MDIWSWLQEVAILIVVYEITAAESDLLEAFRPKEDNPPELNDFLANVLEHKLDFHAVRQAARKYQKMKKDIQDIDPFDNSVDYDDAYNDRSKLEDKRHINHYNVNRKFRHLGLMPPSMHRDKFHRIRRGAKKRATEQISSQPEEKSDIKKRFPEIIMLQEEEDTVQKRMPSQVVRQPVENKIEKHLPSQIFAEPQGEALQKRTPEEIVVESEGEKGRITVDEDKNSNKEKKQAMDFTSPVHKTFKSNAAKGVPNDLRNKQGDVYYVDLEDAAQKHMDRYDDRRRYGWNQNGRGYYFRNGDNYRYNRPFMRRPRPESMDYPHYENGPHHTINDEVAFERALSYEIDPRHQEIPENYNNPSGNNLYAVDEGRPDNIQPFYPQQEFPARVQGGGKYDYPPQDPLAVSNDRYFIDTDNNMKKLETSTTESSTIGTTATPNENGLKSIKHVGPGFIEITKSRRDNEDEHLNIENSLLSKKSPDSTKDSIDKEDQSEKQTETEKEQSSMLSKHSFHPLKVKDTLHNELVQNEETGEGDDELSRSIEERDAAENEEHFQGRKLQFIDYEASNQDENYEDVPNRARRDFLDALGMKNEEDYTEDNPYTDDLNVNNTDVHNDTHIQHDTSHHTCTTTAKPTTSCHQKEDIKNIKKILEEPKEVTGVTTVGNFKKNKGEKRAKKSFSQFEDVDYSDEEKEIRETRGANKEIETKILQNKEKIYSAHEDNRNRNVNTEHVQVRQERTMPKWSEELPKLMNNLKKPVQLHHKINKKEDCEVTAETTETTMEPIPMETTTATCNETDSTAINTTYEQIAHQMDVENEKLAQVVNGHLASKIVSTVFEELKKKTCLKAKFYSGLSRKHVDFAGTIDFDIFKANETEDVDEARLLLGQITKVLNRLVINQVRRKMCQRLPDELKEYLDVLLNVKNTLLEAANFVPNTDQGNFLFTYQEKNEPPFDVKKLQDILVQLESLLLNFHNMNEDCQNKAEPVKEYIEKHVKMLKQIVNCPTHACADKLSESKRDTPVKNDLLVEKQLESVGLGKFQEFIPNFDINQLVKNKMKTNEWKNDKKRDLRKSQKSQQYKKLQQAAERVREKRENEKKIAELFGGKMKRSVKKPDVDYEEPVVYSLG